MDFAERLLESTSKKAAEVIRTKHSYVNDGTCECGEEIGSEEGFKAHLQGEFNSVLREAGLLELLRAGEALCDWNDASGYAEDWDVLKATWIAAKQKALEP
jgi:hypothetical protein